MKVGYRGSEYDVTCRVNTTDPAAVNAEVDRIYLRLYPDARKTILNRVFRDVTALYKGAFPGFHACDTPYHDIQHVLEVTLAMARLVDGYQRSEIGPYPFSESHYRHGIIAALFHDCGYVRRLDDLEHRNGGELTLTHVTRGGAFLREYLPTIGMGEVVDVIAALIHFTGYEIPVSQIEVPSLTYRLLGNLLGSADIIGQMADRCYLEKCRDRLYPEFVAGGITKKRGKDGKEEILYESGEDLVLKTPRFYQVAKRRLNLELGGFHKCVREHFGGPHLYLKETQKNIRFAREMRSMQGALKRRPPSTLAITAVAPTGATD